MPHPNDPQRQFENPNERRNTGATREQQPRNVREANDETRRDDDMRPDQDDRERADGSKPNQEDSVRRQDQHGENRDKPSDEDRERSQVDVKPRTPGTASTKR